MDFLEKINTDYNSKNIVLLFDAKYSTRRLYSDIRSTCLNIIKMCRPCELELLNLSKVDVIITTFDLFQITRLSVNTDYFVLDNNNMISYDCYEKYRYGLVHFYNIPKSQIEQSIEIDNVKQELIDQQFDQQLQIEQSNSTPQTIAINTNDRKNSNIVHTAEPQNTVQSIFKKPIINIVIPTYNQENYTIKCFKSIDQWYDKKYDIEIIWVDNGSTKSSRDKVQQCIDKLINVHVQSIFFDKAIGYVKSTNAGIKQALNNHAEYIILQNNDTVVTENWMDPLINVLKNNNDIIGSGPITNSPLARQGFDKIKINVLRDLPDMSGKPTRWISNKLHQIYKDKVVLIEDENIDVTLAFYCTVFKAEAFDKIGLLDESFGMGYGDDVDYCQRVFIAGYKLAFIPQSYVLHNHRTTFKTIYTEQQIKDTIKARVTQCKIRNTLNTNKKKKYIIYTCITGGYDDLLSYKCVNTKECDYVCFSDTPMPNAPSYWTVVNTKSFAKYLNLEHDLTRLARFFKTHPHLFFPNYQYSMWIDGNIDLLKDPVEYFKLKPKESFILIPQHPLRDCIYDEIDACKQLKKDDNQMLDNVKQFLIDEQYPHHIGLVQSGVIVRDHSDPICIDLMEQWWNQIKTKSKRDQVSFNYLVWKNNLKYSFIQWNELVNNYFKLGYKHSKTRGSKV